MRKTFNKLCFFVELRRVWCVFYVLPCSLYFHCDFDFDFMFIKKYFLKRFLMLIYLFLTFPTFAIFMHDFSNLAVFKFYSVTAQLLSLCTCFSRCFVCSMCFVCYKFFLSHSGNWFDKGKSLSGMSWTEFFSASLLMVLVVKVGEDSVNFKFVESLQVCSFCTVKCLLINWFLKSKLSFSKKEILKGQ